VFGFSVTPLADGFISIHPSWFPKACPVIPLSVITIGFIPLATVGLKLIFPADEGVQTLSLHTSACDWVLDKIVPLVSEADTKLIRLKKRKTLVTEKYKTFFIYIFKSTVFHPKPQTFLSTFFFENSKGQSSLCPFIILFIASRG
jgi:hypothetical protein